MNEWAILTRIGDDNPTNRLSRRDNCIQCICFGFIFFVDGEEALRTFCEGSLKVQI
jgi:hypothetical protein